jgi:hypothetical protein
VSGQPGPRSTLAGGVLAGAVMAIGTVLALSTWVSINQKYSTDDTSTFALWLLALGLWILIPCVGLAVGIVLAVKRWSRENGLGIVLGLTLGIPVMATLSAVILFGSGYWTSP